MPRAAGGPRSKAQSRLPEPDVVRSHGQGEYHARQQELSILDEPEDQFRFQFHRLRGLESRGVRGLDAGDIKSDAGPTLKIGS